jgi:hypothetical protein
MMSKERELLQRCLDEFEYKGVACNELCIDINKLLAKPEQEPVAWMYDHQIEVGYDKYTEVNIIETCARNLESNNCINIRPLYLAPPKQEPLSDAQIAELWGDKHSGKTYKVKNFARAIEKEHGIGGGNE